VPLILEYPAERLRYMLADSGAAVLVTREAHGKLLEGTAALVINVELLVPSWRASRGRIRAWLD